MQKINLFCLPFAGGNRYSYRLYEENLPDFIRLIPLEYPGRGARLNEPLVTDINWLVDDLYYQIRHFIDKERYAIYGHSMGGLVACLLSRKVIMNSHLNPLHVFITGTQGPSALSRGEKMRHLLNKEEFIDELKALNGCPDEILNNDEMLSYFLPILQADFKASETYKYQEYEPMNVPFTVITGTEENMKPEDIQLWQRETIARVDFRRLPGKHFFIFQYAHKITEIIAKKLSIC